MEIKIKSKGIEIELKTKWYDDFDWMDLIRFNGFILRILGKTNKVKKVKR